MKRSLFVLLLSLFLFLRCVGTEAQQKQANLSSYALHILVVSDTHPAQVVWQVDGVNPDCVFGSLHAPSLLQWVDNLPKGTQITYCSPWLGLPIIGRFKSDPDWRSRKELDAFGVYCKVNGVTFVHETAANVPVL